MSERVATAEDIAREWTKADLPFVVAHGLEGYPETVGRDIDVLMNPMYAAEALRIAAEVLRATDWPLIGSPPPLWGRRIAAFRRSTDSWEYLEMHTMAALRWATARLVGHEEPPTHRIGPFPVSNWVVFVKAIMLPLLAGTHAKITDATLAEMRTRFGVEADRLEQLVPIPIARRLLEAIETDAEAVRRLAPVLRSTLLRRSLRSLELPSEALRLLNRKVGRVWSRPGIRVELALDDRWSERTNVDEVVSILNGLFVDVIVDEDPQPLRRWVVQYKYLSRMSVHLELTEGPRVIRFPRWLRHPTVVVENALDTPTSIVTTVVEEWTNRNRLTEDS